MRLEELIATVGLTLASCDIHHPADTPDEVGALRGDFHERFPARTERLLPTEEDLTQYQLTGDCTPVDQLLEGEQFPMRRGTDLLRTFSDGTCLEKLNDDYDGNSDRIYAISGNKKIRFSNLTGDQKRRLFEPRRLSFKKLQGLAIAFIEEAEDEKPDVRQAPAVLFEGPIDECSEYRYRRAMVSDRIKSAGRECIWDERQINCPTVTTSLDSTVTEWEAFLQDGEYVLLDSPGERWRDPSYLDAVVRPTPQQWLGTQPDCPKPGGVVDIDLSDY